MNHDKPEEEEEEEDETHDGKEADLEDSRIKQIKEEVVSPGGRERETDPLLLLQGSQHK